MRKLLGGVVLVAGVAGLGYWGARDHALDMQQAIGAAAQTATSTAVHQVTTEVIGRDIRVTGLADSEAERTALIDALNAVEGRRVVIDELDVLPVADPFTIAATRKNGQTLLQGNVPSEDMRAVLAQSGATGVEGLTLASGAPDRWEPAIGAGLAALGQMDEGTVSLSGTTLRLTGLVDRPADRDALIASVALPEGYTVQNDIETRDDGKPINYEIAYDAVNGVSVDGKLPNGLAPAQIGEALGVAQVNGAPSNALDGDPSTLLATLATLRGWLPEFDTASLTLADDTLQVSGATTPGVNATLVQQSLAQDLGDAASASITASSARPSNGSERTNAATGQLEQFQFGAWLPKISFTPSLASCTTQSDQLMSSVKINFLSGSTDLDAKSQRGINALAAVMGRCVREAGLTAELGGHTDNTGSGNYELSAARAQVVLRAMVDRGVPADALSAVGYGPSKPIADNATEAGRAANRRTTVRWVQ